MSKRYIKQFRKGEREGKNDFQMVSPSHNAFQKVFYVTQPTILQSTWLRAGAVALLTVLVLWAYAPVFTADFISFDDNDYVYENPMVRQGFTPGGVAWAFTSAHAANYHPLTWLSHMLDVEFFDLQPGAHHAVALLLHVANTLLLLWVVSRYGGWFWGALLVAALFALHPLRVQSVAWVSERKDVLCTLFFLLSLISWWWYANRPSLTRYVATCVLLALGLLAKPMLVTLPCLLLVLDVWPLGRIRGHGLFSMRTAKLVLEKLPMFLIVGGSVWLTLWAQGGAGAMSSLEELPLDIRLPNAAMAYWVYLWKTLWPSGLALFHPLTPVAKGSAIIAASGLALVTGVLVVLRKRAPYGLMGWLWFLGSMAPVIGVIQVGGQAWAERYTYIPLMGVAWALVWGVRDLWRLLPETPVRRWGGVALAACVCCVLAWGTRVEAGYWRDSESIYRHTLANSESNYLIHFNLGVLYRQEGRFKEAIGQYEASIGALPQYHPALNNLAFILAAAPDPELRDGERAIELAKRALESGGRSNPGILDTLAAALAETGRYEEAARTAQQAAAIAEHVGLQDMAREIRSRVTTYMDGRAVRIE